jgi:hypothetical protein
MQKRSARTAMIAYSFVSGRRVLRNAWPYGSLTRNPIILGVEQRREAAPLLAIPCGLNEVSRSLPREYPDQGDEAWIRFR